VKTNVYLFEPRLENTMCDLFLVNFLALVSYGKAAK